MKNKREEKHKGTKKTYYVEKGKKRNQKTKENLEFNTLDDISEN